MVERGETGEPNARRNRDGDPSPEAYRSLVESLGEGVFRLDAAGRFTLVNRALTELTGYDRTQLLDEHVSTVLTDRDGDRIDRDLESVLAADGPTETVLEAALESTDGDVVPCEVRLSTATASSAEPGIVGTVRERATPVERGDALSPVWETYESIATVIDETDVGVFVLDDSFDIAWIDEHIEQYFGVDRADLIGRHKPTVIEETIRDRVDDPETFSETVLATYADNSYVEQFECRITPDDDREERWLEHRSTPIESGRYAGGRLELYYDITERKESQRAQRESELRFQSLVDAVDEYAIFMLDPEGHVMSWNEGARQLKGYESDEILGEHLSAFYTDSARADGVPERNLARARESGSTENEGWRIRADGSRFWANVSITAIREDGEIQGYAKVTRDMTDRRAREQQLQRERDLVERILETSPVGIAVIEPDGTITRTNGRMAELLDLSAEDEAPATARRSAFDEYGGRLPVDEWPVSQVFETGKAVYDRELLLEPPDGPRRWLSINATPITDEQGSPERVVTTATDITDLKQLARQRKRELEEREKELTAVQLVTTMLEANEQSVDELLAEFVTELPQFFRSPDDTAVRVSIGDDERATDDYEPTDQRISARTRTDRGTQLRIDVTRLDAATGESQPFLSEERELIDTLATMLRFHVERQGYIEDLRAETRRLEQFAYAASHDLQEPLRMVSSYLQLIERRYGDALDDDGREFLAFAVEGAERMRAMIDGLLAYSRIETSGGPFEPVDLNDVLEDVVTALEPEVAEADAEITVDSLPRVTGDAEQLRLAFRSLLENAIEYNDGEPHVGVAAERRGTMWEISVTDDGIGIPPAEQERIFEVFERLHTVDDHPGTGIGLALCKRIVNRHGGDVGVESTPGEGSTFTVTLPVADDDA
ncbi:PAS domain S-box protein [Natronolimnohabitans innermongolicus]|uniref:histidine kinase n=1 Tax=Natronolimnohabitans innermongolicus JCM 12255 TaxID=1227499 RepID=L9XNQ9_9EURY|nr:PAS domain S-box protein [Natronolimnohabitans innermongolicus]ELY62278.1 PAS/PAC sensor signal transduction histidine kinase [Natronolimnohabitans innermongolicus JCM 12255]